jgi:hypothetical protein
MSLNFGNVFTWHTLSSKASWRKINVKEEKSNGFSRTLMSFEGIKNQWEGRIQEVG